MPEFFCELFCEEIPARLQARAAEDFSRLVAAEFAALAPTNLRAVYGPRRIALAADIAPAIAASSSTERGPRATAPEQALAGFLRKHGATRDALRQDGDFWVLDRQTQATGAAALIAGAMPALLRRFPWPKSMRWGGTSSFTWIRPLRRILCLLDGAVIPFSLATPEDDGHGLASANLTEGHRIHAPGAVPVAGFASWEAALRTRHVITDAAERADLIRGGLATLAGEHGLALVDDPGLIEEVAGLVEWPVPLFGRIDDAFMDLPPEVMQVSMRVNQRYFALRTQDGRAAPVFAFIANLDAPDGGRAIVAGNERVLRARFSDARHFWDLDRKTRLADRVAALEGVTFQAQLGTQGARVRRLVRLAAIIAPDAGAEVALAERAALLAKADLTTGMVGEFPELQGVMGGYYAAHDGEPPSVSAAIRDHYSPRGAGDNVPGAPVAITTALADKLDQLAGFFAIGQKPTGSGDPFALRRAALGVVRIIRENALRIALRPVLRAAGEGLAADPAANADEIVAFITDRLRVQLRAEGARHDVLSAVFAAGADDDLTRLLARTDALAALLITKDGRNLLAAYKRAANILRIEDRRDGPHTGPVDATLLVEPAEVALHAALADAEAAAALLAAERYADATRLLAALRPPLDVFFETVTVNADESCLRLNRLRLLARLPVLRDPIADFSQIDA